MCSGAGDEVRGQNMGVGPLPQCVGSQHQTQVFSLRGNLIHRHSPIVKRERLLKDLESLSHIPEVTTVAIVVCVPPFVLPSGFRTSRFKQKKPTSLCKHTL